MRAIQFQPQSPTIPSEIRRWRRVSLCHPSLPIRAESVPSISYGVGVQAGVRHARELVGALVGQSTANSMRGLLEELQSIELDAEGISTLDTWPDPKLLNKCIAAAEARTTAVLVSTGCDKRIEREERLPAQSFEEIARTQLRRVYAHVSRSSMRVYAGRPAGSKSDDWASFDIIAATKKNELVVYEVKSTPDAPFTPRQKNLITLLEKNEGYISPATPAGPFKTNALIRRQVVRVVRPKFLCLEFARVRLQNIQGGGLLAQGKKELRRDWPL